MCISKAKSIRGKVPCKKVRTNKIKTLFAKKLQIQLWTDKGRKGSKYFNSNLSLSGEIPRSREIENKRSYTAIAQFLSIGPTVYGLDQDRKFPKRVERIGWHNMTWWLFCQTFKIALNFSQCYGRILAGRSYSIGTVHERVYMTIFSLTVHFTFERMP